MKLRLARVTLGAALALVATAPLSQASHAWSCMPPVVSVACFAVGTTCRVVDGATGLGEYCTFS